nr:protein SRC1-like [Ipomoea trifida]
MSGIIHKIEEKLHVGGHKEEKKHHDKAEVHKEEKKHHGGEHKEGLVEKIKDKIHGGRAVYGYFCVPF